ncbi:MAG: hypothetical protein ACFB50_00010 [Rubrobacteraceae bacterium]
MTITRKSVAILIALLVLITGAVAATTALASQGYVAGYGDKPDKGKQYGKVKTVKFDVAEDATRFVFDDEPRDDDGLPEYGNSFVTQGYIYPEGTLEESNGVKANGEPEFPNKVIGEWTCRGWFIGEGATTESGPWVSTTQLYDLGDEPGEVTLVTDGSEISDVNEEVKRAITGGTGPYKRAAGEGGQTLLGFNATEGVNLSFELKVQKR